MTHDFPDYWWDVRVRYGEAGPDGLAKISAVADWFQEAAGLNADELGFGDEALFAQGITWILTRMILRIKRKPAAGEQVRVHTWPAKVEHLAHRGYELVDEQGDIIVRATGAWTVMDLQTRHIVSLPEDLQKAYPLLTLERIPFSCRVVPRLREASSQVSIQVRRDDLDMNGHVNNARYLGWLLEPLPAEATPTVLDVQFRAECFPGDTLKSMCSGVHPLDAADEPSQNGRIHVISRTDDEGRSVDVCRAVSWY